MVAITPVASTRFSAHHGLRQVPRVDSKQPPSLARLVGRRIAELRSELDLTQQRFADQLRVTVDYVRLVERGANLTIASLERFARALQVPVTELFVPPRTMRTNPGRPKRTIRERRKRA